MRKLGLAVAVVAALGGCAGDGLSGTSWRVVEAGELTPSAELPALLEFLPDGNYVGSTGCHRIWGPYEVDGDSLVLGDPTLTRDACEPAELRPQEDAVFSAIGATTHWEIRSLDTLVLRGADGVTMVATPDVMPW